MHKAEVDSPHTPLQRKNLEQSRLVQISSKLGREASQLTFGPPISHVYNPLVYAWAPHRRYLERFGQGKKEVLLVGMNPGPFGMAQTGVPFGDVVLVREWMGLTERVKRPELEHPKRPIEGFNCKRREVSGSRLWTWAKERFGEPDNFFASFFVWNYCPLCFMEESAKNRTPDKLQAIEQQVVFKLCDKALRDIVDVLSPKLVVGVGAFATTRIRLSLSGFDVTVGTILHPSPANPAANKGWALQVDNALNKLMEGSRELTFPKNLTQGR